MSEKFTHADERLGLDSPHVRAAKGIDRYHCPIVWTPRFCFDGFIATGMCSRTNDFSAPMLGYHLYVAV
jgi:hypothetical protein